MKKNNVVAVKADKTRRPSPEIDKFLAELGNTSGAIPQYVIYPGDGGEPIVFDGIITQQQVLDLLEKAGPSKEADEAESVVKQ